MEMNKMLMAALMDTATTTGPYGPEWSQHIHDVEHYYDIYAHGAGISAAAADGAADGAELPEVPSQRVKRMIDTTAEFMLGNAPTFTVIAADDADKERAEQMTQFLGRVLRRNKFPAKLIAGGRDCFIGGSVMVKTTIRPGAKDPVVLTFVPADGYFCKYDPEDPERIIVAILYSCTTDNDDPARQEWWRQRYHMGDDGICYVQEEYFDGYGVRLRGDDDPRSTGLHAIPCVEIKNDGLSACQFGDSDVAAVEAEDSNYTTLRSTNNQSLTDNMDPLITIFGARPDAVAKMSRKHGTINDLAPDPIMGGKHGVLPQVKVYETSFAYADDYKDTLQASRSEMLYTLGIPDIAAAVGSGLVTSGKGLKALYWSLISRCNGKWSTWTPALQEMARIIIDAAEVYPELRTVYGDFEACEYDVTIEPNYALPEDEETEREMDLREVGRARSRKSYLMRWGGADHKGLTSEQADAELKQMAAEAQQIEHIAGFDLV